MQIQRTVHSSRQPADVFAYLSDFTTTTEWDPGTVRTTCTSGDGGLGTRYHNVSTFRGRTTELDYEVVEYDPPRRIRLVGSNHTLTARDTITVEAAGEGSRVTYEAVFTFHGLAKLAAPFLGGAFEELGDAAARGLREALNSST